MAKILFLPVSVISGLIAGLIGRRIVSRAWALVDEEDPPNPRHRQARWLKLLGALALQGAVMRLVRGATDHAARRGFERATGAWPGTERPDPA